MFRMNKMTKNVFLKIQRVIHLDSKSRLSLNGYIQMGIGNQISQFLSNLIALYRSNLGVLSRGIFDLNPSSTLDAKTQNGGSPIWRAGRGAVLYRGTYSPYVARPLVLHVCKVWSRSLLCSANIVPAFC